MSRVHLARLRGVGGFEKKLVIKEILPTLSRDPRFVELFVNEAHALVLMSHPNVVAVYELGIEEGSYFLAMEYVEGTSLADLADGAAPLTPGELAMIGAGVGDALSHAHERCKILHRDVSPRNVMIDTHGHVRLVDFGIALRVDDQRERVAFGTPGFIAPEVERGETATPASDIFGLGRTLRYALARSRGTSAALSQLLDDATRDEPEARPSARDFADRCREVALADRPASLARDLAGRVEETRARSGETRLDEPEVAPAALDVERTPSRSIATSPVMRTWLTPTGAAPEAPASAGSTTPLVRLPTEGAPSTARIDRGTGATSRREDRDGEEAERDVRAASANTPASEESTAETPSPSATPLASATPATTAAPSRVGRVGSLVLGGVLVVAAVALVGRARLDAPYTPVTPRPRPYEPLDRDPPDASVETAAGDAEERDGGAEEMPTTLAATNPIVDDAVIDDAGVDAGGSAEAPSGRAPTKVEGRPRVSIAVQASPFAEVRLDGRTVGRTPLRALELRTGAHVLRLACPPLGRETTVPIDVHGGERVFVDFRTDPPRITTR